MAHLRCTRRQGLHASGVDRRQEVLRHCPRCSQVTNLNNSRVQKLRRRGKIDETQRMQRRHVFHLADLPPGQREIYMQGKLEKRIAQFMGQGEAGRRACRARAPVGADCSPHRALWYVSSVLEVEGVHRGLASRG